MIKSFRNDFCNGQFAFIMQKILNIFVYIVAIGNSFAGKTLWRQIQNFIYLFTQTKPIEDLAPLREFLEIYMTLVRFSLWLL